MEGGIQRYTTENEFGAGVVLSWASIIEDSTIEQALRIARSPIVEGHLALMPDAHFGYGPPVGSALKARVGVMPYAVGVDIGCGMIAVQTNVARDALAGLEGRILGHIRRLIPSGVGTKFTTPSHDAEAFLEAHGLPNGLLSNAIEVRKGPIQKIANDLAQITIPLQFGTLGSGNHFAEVSQDPEGSVWLIVHSGSRGIGNTLATAHFNRARAFCIEHGIVVEHPELSHFPVDTDGFRDYIADMLWCQTYAFQQREAMMNRLLDAVGLEYSGVEEVQRINCHHNYAEQAGDGYWITRKGAINAEPGRMGIIPGSMGAATYIVEGLGNPDAYHSSPHGAGRMYGRNQARKNLSIDEFKREMAGKTWQDRDAAKLIDEAPQAYKPIEQVMADSKDLVRPLQVLSQFINYKGL